MLTALAFLAILSAPPSGLTAGEVTLVSEGYIFTEGPVWLPGEGLIFSDVFVGKIYRADRSVFRNVSERTNGMALDPAGLLLSCESKPKQITRTEEDGTITVLADNYEGNSFNSTNDIAIRSDGLVYFTDPGKTPKSEMSHNGIYSLDPATRDLTLLSKTLKFPNGIGFSPDESILYVADYLGGAIMQYDVDEKGGVSNVREFASVVNPDGFAIDAEGKLWAAAKPGVVIFSPGGEQLGVIELPDAPTNCCFGGKDGKTLFVTARKKVYKIRTATPGLGEF